MSSNIEIRMMRCFNIYLFSAELGNRLELLSLETTPKTIMIMAWYPLVGLAIPR